jgi:hypothetical protein
LGSFFGFLVFVDPDRVVSVPADPPLAATDAHVLGDGMEPAAIELEQALSWVRRNRISSCLRKIRFDVFNGVALIDDDPLQVRNQPHYVIKTGVIFIVSVSKIEDRCPISPGE